MVFSSAAKYPISAPYSGDMLAIVALSAIDNFSTPGPKNSTNLLATPSCLRCCQKKFTKLFINSIINVNNKYNYFCYG